MRQIETKYLYCLILLLLSYGITGQQRNFRIQKISVEEGLSHYSVNKIVQDKLGFIWFGTEAGLNRYDGYHFRKYFKDEDNPNSLSDDMVSALHIDDENNLWIGASKSPISKFNIANETFDAFDQARGGGDNLGVNHRTIVGDKNNTLWFGGNEDKGLAALNLENGYSRLFTHNEDDLNSIAGNSIISLFCDKSDNLWIGTANGYLDKYNIETDSFVHYELQKLNTDFSVQSVVWGIFIDSKNNIWVSIDNGLYLFNETEKSFEKLLKNPAPKTHAILGFVNSIVEDKQGNIWAGSENGLYLKYVDNESFEYLANVTPFKEIIGTKNVTMLCVDESGIIWAAAYGNGIFKIDPTIKDFKPTKMMIRKEKEPERIIVRSIEEGDNSNIWVGTIREGLFLYNKGKLIAQFKSTFSNDYELNNNVVNNIKQLSNGEIWLATDGGGVNVIESFNHENPGKTKFRYHLNDANNPYSLGSNNVTTIYEDNLKRVWIGYNTGMSLYDQEKNIFYNLSNIPQVNDRLREVQSNCILHEKDNIYWVGTWNGLLRLELMFLKDSIGLKDVKYFDKREGDKKGLSDKRITALYLGGDSVLWIGTYGGGLNRININDIDREVELEIKSFSKKDGLISNEIFGIQADENGNLWISSIAGLSKFIISHEKFSNYNENDGLISDNFFWGASSKSKDGRILLGQVGGFIAFNPDSVSYSNFNPPVVLTQFTLKNKKALIGNSPEALNDNLETSLNFIKEIKLDYSFEAFSIEFAALHFSAPHKTKYKYILEGYNSNWVETDSEHRIASYTNLNPGRYTFRVISSNNDGIWGDNERSIKIKVLKPFWQKWWFYLLELLLVAAIIIGIVKLRERKLRIEKGILEDMVRERTRRLLVQNEEISQQNEEIITHNEEISAQKELLEKQKSKILVQNKEILEHKEHLEQKIEERTKDLATAKDEAERADQLKTSFLENLSHEIRTPLNAIVGFTGLLSKSLKPDGKEANYIKYISTSSNTLLEIINSIVQISKIQLGEFQVTFSKFLLNDFLQHLYREFSLANEANKSSDVKFHLDIENMVPGTILNTDLEALRLVMYHLIGNALKFTEEGNVEFGVLKQNENSIELFVKDTGIGISEEDIKNIFEKFRKVETDKARLYRGLGLGLTIAKSITQKLGGEIWLESEIGKGSTFFVSLPLI